jgi:hypothetical protein
VDLKRQRPFALHFQDAQLRPLTAEERAGVSFDFRLHPQKASALHSSTSWSYRLYKHLKILHNSVVQEAELEWHVFGVQSAYFVSTAELFSGRGMHVDHLDDLLTRVLIALHAALSPVKYVPSDAHQAQPRDM